MPIASSRLSNHCLNVLVLFFLVFLLQVNRVEVAAQDTGSSLVAAKPDAPPGGGARSGGPRGCDKDVIPDMPGKIAEPHGRGLALAGLFESPICDNGALALFEQDATDLHPARLIALQAGGGEAGLVATDITEPSNPMPFPPLEWDENPQGSTVTNDLLVFRRNGRFYVALALARTHRNGRCGVAAFDITNLPGGIASTFFNRENLEPGERWCNATALAVETDGNGDATHLYVAAEETADLRVLEITGPDAGPTEPEMITFTEVGCYRHAGPRGADPDGDALGPNDPDGPYDDIFVSSIAVQDGLVYVGYWRLGVHILSAETLRETEGECLVSDESSWAMPPVEPENIAPDTPFLVGHAMPAPDGDYLFLLDPVTYAQDSTGAPLAAGVPVVQMWSLNGQGAPSRTDALFAGGAAGDVPAYPPRRLSFGGQGEDTWLYVAWNRLGLQAWAYGEDGFETMFPSLASAGESAGSTAGRFHQAQDEPDDGPESGAQDIAIETIDGTPYAVVSDRAYGLIIDEILPLVAPAE